MSDWEVQLILNAMSVMDQDRLTDEERRNLAESNRIADYVAAQYYYDQDARENNEMRRYGE